MRLLLAGALLILLSLANGAPVLAKKALRGRCAWPVDGGLQFADGRPLLGPSKTWRGVASALLASAAGASLFGLGWRMGLLFGGAAMAGDLFSSFVKRRLGRPASSRATGLDQVPEALFPLLACRDLLELDAAEIALVVAVFFAGEVVLSRLLYRLDLRDRPY